MSRFSRPLPFKHNFKTQVISSQLFNLWPKIYSGVYFYEKQRSIEYVEQVREAYEEKTKVRDVLGFSAVSVDLGGRGSFLDKKCVKIVFMFFGFFGYALI